jgi:hypothetical protein
VIEEIAEASRLTPPYHLFFEAGTGRVFLEQAGRSRPIAFVADPQTGGSL